MEKKEDTGTANNERNMGKLVVSAITVVLFAIGTYSVALMAGADQASACFIAAATAFAATTLACVHAASFTAGFAYSYIFGLVCVHAAVVAVVVGSAVAAVTDLNAVVVFAATLAAAIVAVVAGLIAVLAVVIISKELHIRKRWVFAVMAAETCTILLALSASSMAIIFCVVTIGCTTICLIGFFGRERACIGA